MHMHLLQRFPPIPPVTSIAILHPIPASTTSPSTNTTIPPATTTTTSHPTIHSTAPTIHHPPTLLVDYNTIRLGGSKYIQGTAFLSNLSINIQHSKYIIIIIIIAINTCHLAKYEASF